ncbi:MAG: hypothetical protein AAGB34_06470, partial [Planctomycetota bacterium]
MEKKPAHARAHRVLACVSVLLILVQLLVILLSTRPWHDTWIRQAFINGEPPEQRNLWFSVTKGDTGWDVSVVTAGSNISQSSIYVQLEVSNYWTGIIHATTHHHCISLSLDDRMLPATEREHTSILTRLIDLLEQEKDLKANWVSDDHLLTDLRQNLQNPLNSRYEYVWVEEPLAMGYLNTLALIIGVA